MRELQCACGNRLVAQDDQELTREVLTHAREAHPEMHLTEEQAKEMVASRASLVLFGGLGALGMDALSTPRDVVAWALAAMFAFAASAHFVARTRGDLIAMVPGVFPKAGLSW